MQLYFLLLCIHAGLKGLASSSWSADIGVGRPSNSPSLHVCGSGSGKTHSHSSPQQGKPQGCRGGKVMYVTFNTSSAFDFLFSLATTLLQLLCTCILDFFYVSYLSIFPQELGVITDYFIYVCSSTTRNIFLGILYGYKMLLQVIALVLAFSTRKVKVKGLDDAKYIAAAIYVTSIVLTVIIVATYTLNEFVNAYPALFCTGFLIGTTVILGLVFVPKV